MNVGCVVDSTTIVSKDGVVICAVYFNRVREQAVFSMIIEVRYKALMTTGNWPDAFIVVPERIMILLPSPINTLSPLM